MVVAVMGIRPLSQAQPAEFFPAQDAGHVITPHALFHRVMAEGAMLHLNACNQLIFLGGIGHQTCIRCILLSEDLRLLTCGWPVGIFLALEAPHGTTDTHHWEWLHNASM